LDEDMPQGEAKAMGGELPMRDETQIPCGDDNQKTTATAKGQWQKQVRQQQIPAG
jgi:hypothetical protein